MKRLLLSLTIVVLLGAVVFAVRQEIATKPPSAAASFTAGLGTYRNAPPLTAEEESYAAALWPIHDEVKRAAVRMIFAGLNYKSKNLDARTVRDNVQPLVKTFQSASQRAQELKVPASLADAHDSYVEALTLYASAAREMTRVAEDGSDAHLIEAQRRSERASVALLKLSDVLWPGEYKPN
jgi:hypothetical protein